MKVIASQGEMSVLRNVLLAGSQSAWLREQAPRYPFVRRTVKRFMPGERASDALDAATALQRDFGITTILTHLGENLTNVSEAEEVTQHYLELLDSVKKANLDAQVSIKLTQLGLDQRIDVCCANLSRLIMRAADLGNMIWIDMESSEYVDRTLDVFRQMRQQHRNVGVCLQAYLYRTADDLESLFPLGPAIRLVKGAYREPANVAFPRKADVDDNYFKLATRLLGQEATELGAFVGLATHDARLIQRLETLTSSSDVSRDRYEFEMLYGIQRAAQERLARQGQRLRVLISYGEHWFPWFMRRLAERPANMLFVAKNLFAR